MKVFSIHKGTTRTVVLVYPLNLAFKFPQFNLFKAIVCLGKIFILYFKANVLKQGDPEGDLQWEIKWVLKGHYERDHPVQSISNILFRGIMANWNERIFFLEDPENPLLIPTHFSFFGLINIQTIIKPCKKYSIGLYNKLLKLMLKEEMYNCDTHAWEDQNFTQREDGSVALYDYGSSRAWPFIKKYGKQFSTILQTT